MRSTPRAFSATAGATLAIALGVAGCGGDDGPSRAEYVKEANAICKRHYEKISAAASKLLAGGQLPSPQEFGRLAMGTIIPEYEAQIGELRDVEAPEEQADAHRKWLDDSEALKTRVERNPVLIQRQQELAAVNGQADRLGLDDDCHIGPG